MASPSGCCGRGRTERPVSAFFEQRCFYYRGRSYGAILLLAGVAADIFFLKSSSRQPSERVTSSQRGCLKW